MKLPWKESIFLPLLLFVDLTACGKNAFSVCATGNLRVTEAFEASRLAASLFPCFVSGVFLKYKPPTKMVLVGYRALCFSIRACFALTPTNRITNKDDFATMTSCFTGIWMNFTKMDVFRYYGLPPDMTTRFGKGEFLRPLFAQSFECMDGAGAETFRTGPDIGIAVLRWMMERLF